MRHCCIAIIGAPLDFCAGRRGVAMGPSAIRLAGLDERVEALGYEVQDLGNVTVAQPEATPVGPERARFLPQIAQTCTRLGEMVYRSVLEDKLPLVLGGDHSIAVGTVAGLARAHREKGGKVGLI